MMSKLQVDFIKADIEHLEARKERLSKQIKTNQATLKKVERRIKDKTELIVEI